MNSAGTTKGNIFYDSDNNFMVFKTDGTASSNERLRIDSSGRALINTTTATGAAKLQLLQTTGQDALLVRNHDTNYEAIILANASGEARVMASSGGSTARPALTFFTSDAEKLRINTDGKVGIATGTGSGLINTRNAGTNQQVLHFRADLGSSNGRSFSLYTPDTDNSTAPFRFQTGNGYLFQCDSEDVFTINHDRTLLINTTAVTNTGDSLTVKRSPSGFGEMSMSVDANTSTSSAANAFIFTKSKHTYWNGYGFQSSHGHIGAIVGKRDSAGTSDQE